MLNVHHNHFTTLGLRTGASVWEVQEAADRLIAAATASRDFRRLEMLEEARHWLTTPVLRAFHIEKLGEPS